MDREQSIVEHWTLTEMSHTYKEKAKVLIRVACLHMQCVKKPKLYVVNSWTMLDGWQEGQQAYNKFWSNDFQSILLGTGLTLNNSRKAGHMKKKLYVVSIILSNRTLISTITRRSFSYAVLSNGTVCLQTFYSTTPHLVLRNNWRHKAVFISPDWLLLQRPCSFLHDTLQIWLLLLLLLFI